MEKGAVRSAQSADDDHQNVEKTIRWEEKMVIYQAKQVFFCTMF